MVRARIHIICGNCGCNDDFKYKIAENYLDYETRFEDAAIIICNNCATLHTLDDTIQKDAADDRDEG